MSNIRLVIADVDGTLLTQAKELTARARSAVGSLRRAGVSFALVSGRPPRGMRMLIEPLELDTPLTAFNGGLLETPDFAALERECLPAELVGPIIEALTEHGLDVWLYDPGAWWVRDLHGLRVDHERQTVEFAPHVVKNFEEVPRELMTQITKITGVGGDDFGRTARAEAELQTRFGARITALRSQPYYLDVTSPKATKANAVHWLSARLALPPAQIATIGDSPNDLPMFHASGLSIAMGNASPEVKSAAHAVTLSNEQDGFAQAIERLMA